MLGVLEFYGRKSNNNNHPPEEAVIGDVAVVALQWEQMCCRQCDFSAPFEWKRNLHLHCYATQKTCKSLRLLYTAAAAGRAAVEALLLRVLCSPCPSICCQITTSLTSSCCVGRSENQTHARTILHPWLIELMCCLWSINSKHTNPFARDNSQPRIQTLQNTHSQSISIRHGRRQGILFAPPASCHNKDRKILPMKSHRTWT